MADGSSRTSLAAGSDLLDGKTMRGGMVSPLATGDDLQ
jgi:hypothetical protein